MSDIELQEAEPIGHIDIMNSQLELIATMKELPEDLYDQLIEHKIRAINNAMIIIHQCQYDIHRELLSLSVQNK